MADLTPEQILAALREAGDASVERFTNEILQAEKILDIYRERGVLEKTLGEQIAQNNKIMEAEARAAQAKYQEGIKFLTQFADKERDLHELRRQNGREYLDAHARVLAAFTASDAAAEAAAKTEREAIKQRGKDLRNQAKALRRRNDELEATKVTLQEEAEATLGVNNANKKAQSSLRGMIKTMTGLTGETQTAVGMLAQLSDADRIKVLGNLKKTLKASFTPFLIAENILQKIGESTLAFMKQFDKLAASFRKNSAIIDRGFSGIEQRIVNVQRANLRMGVSIEEAFGAGSALVSSMAQFTSMTDKAQNQVMQITTLMQEFGVSAQTTAEIFNTFSKGLGYNSQQLEKVGLQLMALSTSLQIPPQIIATEFNSASKELTKYGGDMVSVFKGLAEQSKQTGVAINELMGIVKQYDTFEGAGAAVGKLNAILGGPYLNAINMLYATEEDRVKMLRESIALSGRQFSELSRFEQQAIASAAGINDMAQAAKLFGGTESEFAKNALSMKEMQERAAKAQSVQEKFTQVMQSFAIALGPVVHALGAVFDALAIVMNPFTEIFNMSSEFGPILNTLFVGFMSLGAAITFASQATIALLAPWVAGIATFTMLITLTEGLSKGMKVMAGFAIIAAAALIKAGAAAALAAGPLTFGASVVAYSAMAVAAGAAAAGTITAFKGIAAYSMGKVSGTKVPGGRGQLAEDGNREILQRGGKSYMVNSPTEMDLKDSDTILNNSQTEAALAGGGSAQLVPVLTSLQATLNQLAAAIKQANQASTGKKSKKPIIIEMDTRVVAETTADWIEKHTSLKLA